MLSTDIPTPFPIPFGNSAGVGYIRTVPTDSQIGITAGAASLEDGFPPLNATALDAGGYPPDIQDMNGILNPITAALRWIQAGGPAYYDSSFSTAIGGYPSGAILQSASQAGFWRSLSDNNTTDPDSNGAGWAPFSFFGISSVAVTTADVTLTLAQYSNPIIAVTGAMTGNRNLILPGLARTWTILNGTTGGYALTVKASGTGVITYQGQACSVYGNGTNVFKAYVSSTAASGYSNVAPGVFSKPVSGFAFTGLTDGANTTIAAPAKDATALRIAFNLNVGATGSAGSTRILNLYAATNSGFGTLKSIATLQAPEPSGLSAGIGLAYANPELIIPLDAIGGNAYIKLVKWSANDVGQYDVRGYLTNP